MSRPDVIVTITEEAPRRGAPTDTGTAFMAFAAGANPATPPAIVVARSAADVAAAFPIAEAANITAWVGDALATGANTVVVVRAQAATAGTVTQAEWTAALDRLGEDYGPGQVLIPGVATPAATAALVDHANRHAYRCVLIDGGKTTSAEDLVAVVAGIDEDALGLPRVITVAPWVKVSAPAGSTREVPGVVVTAGLVARNDAAVGHANNAPVVTQGRDAGVVRQGLDVTKGYTDAERDALNDGGVSIIRMRQGRPTLYGWRSAALASKTFRGAGAGRFTMQLDSGLANLMEQFLGRQIDGQGLLYGEVDGVLRDYYEGLWERGALYGATAAEAYQVRVADVNDAQDAADEIVNSESSLKITRSAERINLNVAVTTAEGSIAA